MSMFNIFLNLSSKKNKKDVNFLHNFIDSDNDGLSNWEEVNIYHTDPFNSDTDNDGMNDGEEVRKGRNPLGKGRLKNIFLSNKENDYCPHIFQIKKLLFFSFSAFLLKTAIISLIIFLPIKAWLTPSVHIIESQKIINLTNELRNSLHLSGLSKNQKLTEVALNKANDMFVGQYFDHVSKDNIDLKYWLNNINYQYSIAGENLAMGYKGADSIFNEWKKSQYHYNNLVNPSYEDIGVAMLDGIYKGKETIITVQVFGSTNNKDIEPVTNNKVDNIKYDIISSDIKDNGKLSAPLLIIPYKTNLINTNKISLNIIAPNADKVFVYNDNVLVNEVNLGEFKNFWTKINLKDGKHTIQVKSVKGKEESFSIRRIINIDTIAPKIIGKKTGLIVNNISKNKYIVKAFAGLESDTMSARVEFNKYSIKLLKDNNNEWNGDTIITNYQDIFNTLIGGTLIVTDYAGNIARYNIGWKNIIPVKSSLLDKYYFLKNSTYSSVHSLFNISYFYSLILISVFFLILVINILLNFKKQKFSVVFSIILFLIFIVSLMII